MSSAISHVAVDNLCKSHLSPVFTRVKIFPEDLLAAADVCAGHGYCIALALTVRAHLGQGRMIGGLPPLRPRKLITADTVLPSITGLYAQSGFVVKCAMEEKARYNHA